MDWMINVFWGSLQQIIFGGILFLLWKPMSIYLQRIGAVQWAFTLLKCILFFYMIPVGYIIYSVKYRLNGFTSDVVYLYTPVIYGILTGLTAVWLIGCIISFSVWILNNHRLNRLLKAHIDCSPEVYELIEKISAELNIKVKVKAYQNEYIHTPFIIHAFSPVIYLPAITFDQDTLKLILTHELLHYKNRDLIYKYLGVWLICIQWFNPFTQKIFSEIDQWCEFYCDYSVYKHIGSVKNYFTMMLQFQSFPADVRLTAMLFEKGSNIKRRIEGMKFIQLNVKKKIFKTVLAFTVFVALGTGSVYAADIGFRTFYGEIVDRTAESVEEELTWSENTLTEYTENGMDEGVTVVDAPQTKASNSINWSIGNNAMMRSGEFYVASGGRITITAFCNPSNASLKMGIVTPGGSRRYVTFTGEMNHTFSIDTSGYYRIFVENRSGGSVAVSGTYLY